MTEPTQQITEVPPSEANEPLPLKKFIEMECLRIATLITKTDATIQDTLNDIRKLQDMIRQREDQVLQLRSRITHMQGSTAAYRNLEKQLEPTAQV
jgi:hypothetical protein